MRRRALKILLGLVAGIILLELGLQLAGVMVRARSRTGRIAPSAGVILCLGDSHTYGAGVAEEASYPAQLEALLREQGYLVSVVNLGAPGYNTSQLRRRLPQWLEDYRPAGVIILAGVNNGWNRSDATGSDAQDGRPVPAWVRAADWLRTRVRLLRGLSLLRHRLDWTRPAEEDSQDRSGARVIHHRQESWTVETPAATCDRLRRDLVAMIAMTRAGHAIPVLMTYVTDPVYTFEVPNQYLREVGREMNVVIADNDRAVRPLFTRADGSFDQAARDGLFLPDMHPNPNGYQAMTRNVIQALGSAGVLDLLPTKKAAENGPEGLNRGQ